MIPVYKRKEDVLNEVLKLSKIKADGCNEGIGESGG